jgi:hypothetical protein
VFSHKEVIARPANESALVTVFCSIRKALLCVRSGYEMDLERVRLAACSRKRSEFAARKENIVQSCQKRQKRIVLKGKVPQQSYSNFAKET